jgi:hypothetical protein
MTFAPPSLSRHARPIAGAESVVGTIMMISPTAEILVGPNGTSQ